MTQYNPFAPPKAPIDGDSTVAAEASGLAQCHFPVSQSKLAVMTLLTFGLYEIHWFERQWRFHSRATGTTILPLARGLFSPFFAHALFRDVRARADARGIACDWTPSGQGGFYVGMWVIAVLGGGIAAAQGYAGASEALNYVGWARLVPMLKVQATINALVRAQCPGLDMNELYTALNIVGILLGGLVWLGVVVNFATR